MREVVKNTDTEEAYSAIKNSKAKYGTYHKTCFHIHTPASYDYCLLEDWKEHDYLNATAEDVFECCKEYKIFPNNYEIKHIKLKGDLSVFCNIKELLSYCLIAHALGENEIEIAVVTDHNTIEGFNKLKLAVEYLNRFKKFKKYPMLLLGIEISCADKNHIVGIFDDESKTKETIENWLYENLFSKDKGTIKTGLDVLKFIQNINGIGYIAHINSSHMLNPGVLSGAYKTNILNNSNIVGVRETTQIKSTSTRIKKYVPKAMNYVIDNDAHKIQELSKNCFWIKCSTVNFYALKEALKDYDVSVSLEEIPIPKNYIKGIYIKNRESGFLKGKKDKGLCIRFSPALTCLIGGRGTGKSSLLEILEFVFNQYCLSPKKLNFICDHGNIWVLYQYEDTEYFIEFRTPRKKNHYDNILEFFGFRNDKISLESWEAESIEDEIRKKHITVYRVKTNGKVHFVKENNKNKILSTLFDTTYSVNELVKAASGNGINDFIYKTMFSNETLSAPEKNIKVQSQNGLIKKLQKISKILEDRKKEVCNVIDKFNEAHKKVLVIKYSQKRLDIEPPIKELFKRYNSRYKWYNRKNISVENVCDYLLTLHSILGVWDFWLMVLTGDVELAKEKLNILEFKSSLNQNMIERNVSDLKAIETDEYLSQVFKELYKGVNLGALIEFIKKCVVNIESFELNFNVNNKEGNLSHESFKSVEELSLGQKVVAMLTFVISYSEFSNDFRPLIIDQPEDNLDNQYIYKNLVKQLREIKEKRQVIIATHNATIVTNARADLVCVMNSKDNHGWISAAGYTGDTRIKNHIINHLEGGKESFLHKKDMYDTVLNENK